MMVRNKVWASVSIARRTLLLTAMQRTYAELSEAAQRRGEAEVIRSEAPVNNNNSKNSGNSDNAASQPVEKDKEKEKEKGQEEPRPKPQPQAIRAPRYKEKCVAV